MTGRRYRLYPNAEQAPVLSGWIGCARAIYNAKDTEERYQDWLRRYAKFSARSFAPDERESAFTFDQAFSHLKPSKAEAPWFHEVPSQIYRNAMYQRSQAWAKHWKDPKHAGRPGRRKKGETDSILLTNELFQFWGAGLILVGTPKHFVGVLEYHEHRPCGEPNSVTITRDTCNRWWVSFCFDDGIEAVSGSEILTELNALTNEDIAAVTVGHDRGIVQQVTGSDGRAYGLSKEKQARFVKYQRRIKVLSKKLSRQKDKKSRRRAKTRIKLAKAHAHVADLRSDHAHQVSHRIVSSPARVCVFEKLNLRGMTRSARGTVEDPGRNVRAKSGLNRALLHQTLGRIVQFTRYKATRVGKLIVEVPAALTSQRCNCCGHTEQDNRNGIRFQCKKCGYTAHADANASVNIKDDGVIAVLTMLGRSMGQPFAEATRARTSVHAQGANEAKQRSSHLAA